MTEKRWDVVDERLARIAETTVRRTCSCGHFHPKGEKCGYPKGGAMGASEWCTCSK